MARSRFTPTTRFVWDQQVYLVRQLLPDDYVLIDNETFGGQSRLARAELEKEWVSGRLRFELTGPNIRQVTNSTIATSYTFDDFQTLPPKYQQEAWRRYQLLLPLLKIIAPNSDHQTSQSLRLLIEQYLKSLQNPSLSFDCEQTLPSVNLHPPTPTPATPLPSRRTRAPIGEALSRASLERWLSSFRQSGWDIRSLIPQSYRQGGPGRFCQNSGQWVFGKLKWGIRSN